MEVLVEYLCDFDADPMCAKNKEGKWPVDYARTHKAYQVLNLTGQRLAMERELKELQLARDRNAAGIEDESHVQEKSPPVTMIGTKLVADKVCFFATNVDTDLYIFMKIFAIMKII